MAEKENKDSKNQQRPKFNLYWVYGMVVLAIVFIMLTSIEDPGGKITQNKRWWLKVMWKGPLS